MTTQAGRFSVAAPSKPSSKRSVIILTSGLSGSSVLTGLISRAGYWTGDHTFQKEYDTHENVELIELNSAILREAGYHAEYTMEFSQSAIDQIAMVKDRIDPAPYRSFLEKCAAHGPWLWKDPRLWLTIRVWARFLPLSDCRFILLNRDITRSWVSATLRRQIRSYSSFRQYELSIQESITGFLNQETLSWLTLTYEELIGKPEAALAALNQYLGTQLAVEDLRRVYRGDLYKTPRSSLLDFCKAGLIYLKNR